ncbi:MAG: hypothetical protein ACXADL_11955 [Candidatus Thorarchaeota archaeon]|jgi:predicted  nucleic acid-binding Zn-ribbon protein
MFKFRKVDRAESFVTAMLEKMTTNLKEDIVANVLDGCDRKLAAVMEAEDTVSTLTRAKTKLEAEIAKLRSQHKIEETEIKTLIKVAEEKNALELERKTLALQKVALEDKARQDEKYHKELAAAIEKERDKMETFMAKVMDQFQGRDIQVIK